MEIACRNQHRHRPFNILLLKIVFFCHVFCFSFPIIFILNIVLFIYSVDLQCLIYLIGQIRYFLYLREDNVFAFSAFHTFTLEVRPVGQQAFISFLQFYYTVPGTVYTCIKNNKDTPPKDKTNKSCIGNRTKTNRNIYIYIYIYTTD